MLLGIDFELAELLLIENSGVSIANDNGYGRLDEDVSIALNNILDNYLEMKGVQDNLENTNRELIKHVNKLEKMLNRRDVSFKDWEAVYDEKGLYYGY